MKINKNIYAFIATAIMAVGVASCSDDDAVDNPRSFTIDLVTNGLDDTQQVTFNNVVKTLTYSEDTEDKAKVNYGFYSTREYAQNRYDEFLTSNTLDSIINVFADENNITDYSVNVVLKEGENIIQTSQSIVPSIKKNSYTLVITQQDGSLDAASVQALSTKTEEVFGTAPGTAKEFEATPTYATNYYTKTLPKQLAESITELVPASPIKEDFSETVTLTNNTNSTTSTIIVQPYCDYAVWYEVEQGSLDDTQLEQLKQSINLNIFNALTISEIYYDKRQKYDRATAKKEFSDRLVTYNYALQNNVINEIAGTHGITDFKVIMKLSSGDMSTKGKYDLIVQEEYTPNVETSEYRILYEVTYGSLSSANKAIVNETLDKILNQGTTGSERALGNIYEQAAKKAYAGFLKEPTGYVNADTGAEYKVENIAQYLAQKTMTLDFTILFKLVDSRNIVVDKTTFKASEGWNIGK